MQTTNLTSTKKFEWLNENSRKFLAAGYLGDGLSAEERIANIAKRAEELLDMPGFADKFYDYMSQGFYSLASPVWSNFGKERGLPISCFGSHIDDDIGNILYSQSEVGMMSKLGGGTSGYFGKIRHRGAEIKNNGEASGAVHIMRLFESMVDVVSQGSVRRGRFSPNLPIDHPDIMEFLQIRIPTGDVGRKCLNIHHAVNVTDEFMTAVEEGKDWNLLDPNDKSVRETMSARKLWELVLETRFRTGEPYINFIDTANRYLPESLKKKGLKIHGSNLCNEIHLPTNEDRTAVCCLSSLNLEKYDEWKDTSLVRDLTRYLDNVLQFFIDHAGDEISRAKYSAQQERSLGLGAMGFHSYLQQHRIPFESGLAISINKAIFKQIKDYAVEETELLAKERGEAPDMEGTGKRNSHLLAIAPNANSSMIVSCSPSIEPHKANAYTHRTRAGSHLIKNRYLKEELEKVNMETPEVWTSIITNGGSVQHLEFLSDELKKVFKTAIEINQNVIVQLAGDRQKYLCQGQSLNVYFPAGASKKYLHEVHFKAWKEECKGLYYLRTETSNRAENVAEKVELNKLTDLTDIQKEEDECIACQG